jgi:hypothetical protein
MSHFQFGLMATSLFLDMIRLFTFMASVLLRSLFMISCGAQQRFIIIGWALWAFFAAMGFGALNELIEFLAVLSVPETGVGGYYNTGLDIVANALGAICAAFIAPYLFKERPH